MFQEFVRIVFLNEIKINFIDVAIYLNLPNKFSEFSENQLRLK